MNSQTHDIYKAKKDLEVLEDKAAMLLIEIRDEPDIEKNILLVRDYSNLQGRIDAADKIVNKDSKQKTPITSYQKIQSISTKRCGSV